MLSPGKHVIDFGNYAKLPAVAKIAAGGIKKLKFKIYLHPSVWHNF
jgi:predicted nicotinamide N-methyase